MFEQTTKWFQTLESYLPRWGNIRYYCDITMVTQASLGSQLWQWSKTALLSVANWKTYLFCTQQSIHTHNHVPLSIPINSKWCKNKFRDKTSYADTWTKRCKYKWSLSNSEEFKKALTDEKPAMSRNNVLESFIYMATSNEKAVGLGARLSKPRTNNIGRRHPWSLTEITGI